MDTLQISESYSSALEIGITLRNLYRDQCKQQVHGYSGAVFKSFKTLNEAKQFTGQSAEHRFCNRQSKIKSHAAPYKTYKKQHRSVCTEQQQTPVVYSDGCCFNNGQSGARAGVGVFWQDESVW